MKNILFLTHMSLKLIKLSIYLKFLKLSDFYQSLSVIKIIITLMNDIPSSISCSARGETNKIGIFQIILGVLALFCLRIGIFPIFVPIVDTGIFVVLFIIALPVLYNLIHRMTLRVIFLFINLRA